jgi:hypothetical protein
MEVHVKPVIDAVTVRPGDTLIVKLATDLDMQQAQDATERLEKHLPGVKVIAIGADQLLVYRPDDGAA